MERAQITVSSAVVAPADAAAVVGGFGAQIPPFVSDVFGSLKVGTKSIWRLFSAAKVGETSVGLVRVLGGRPPARFFEVARESSEIAVVRLRVGQQTAVLTALARPVVAVSGGLWA